MDLFSIFRRQLPIDRLIKYTDNYVCMYNGISDNNTIVYPDHVKKRHLKITLGEYESVNELIHGGNPFPHIVYIWIDKNRKIVELVSDISRSKSGGYKLTRNDRKHIVLCGNVRKNGVFKTNNKCINEFIDWFFNLPSVYFPIKALDITKHFHEIMEKCNRDLGHALKDKSGQKKLIHELNCSK